MAQRHFCLYNVLGHFNYYIVTCIAITSELLCPRYWLSDGQRLSLLSCCLGTKRVLGTSYKLSHHRTADHMQLAIVLQYSTIQLYKYDILATCRCQSAGRWDDCVAFRKSLDKGIVPADWKLSNVSPIFKKGSRTLAENYRPVS